MRLYVSLLALGVASSLASAQGPKAPPSLDQLIADLEGAKKKKADATKAEAESKEALEKYVKELHEKLGKLGLNPCPPVVPPPPPIIVPPPSTQADPVGATGRLRFGSSGCTATVIGPRRADGRWDVLTASHCTGGVGARGTMTMKDGRAIPVVVTARETSSDISWMVTEGVVESLPHAFLAVNNPAAETGVWHMGYGVDVPGNREEGRILGATLQGQLAMELSVSSGDSGSGIFRRDTNELVAVVCCTTRKGAKVTMYGGSCERAAQLKPPIRTDTGGSWEPMDIPIVKVGG